MIYIAVGSLGFLIIHLFDIVAIKKIPRAKPIIWSAGSILLVYALVMLSLQSNTLPLPLWSVGVGWILFGTAFVIFIYALFINLPFRKTYIASGAGDKLVRNRLYTLVRHPGVLFFTLVLLSLILISHSYLLLIATPVFILLDIVLVVIQDKFFFVRMFDDYNSYKKITPMLLPNRQSITAFINSIKQA